MVCFNLKFTYNFALLINMMLLMKKGILGCNIIYLFILICIGIALPIKSQNNYKVKLTGTVYEYDHNNKRLPLEFAAVSIPEIALGTTSDENGRYILENVPTGKIRMQIQYLGNSTREISDWMEENLGNRVSAETISSITDRVLPEIQSWRSRPLENVYAIVWMDAIHYKVMDEKNRPVTRAIYNIIGISPDGYKDLLGMYISKSEGANFWLSCLSDIQTRGVKDILIACTDNLTGFSDAIKSVFPETTVQTCIVHQIRNSIKYVASKNQKTFMKDLKLVYQAVSKEQAEVELDNLERKWGEDYPIVIKSWRENWDKLSAYFRYSDSIRKMIYTTNTVEGYHRQIRKVTKNKGVFTNDTALEKLVYLAYRNIRKKWTMPLANWGKTAQQLAILYPDRFKLF